MAGRAIKVKCTTWDQVEAFSTQKVRNDLLVLRMPAMPQVDHEITVALVMGSVFATPRIPSVPNSVRLLTKRFVACGAPARAHEA